tara:strand:+ start:4836 stop:6065 length:1230 start_codon:yes stop_codon:yes gene_type:complete
MQTSSATGTGDGFFAEGEEALQEIVFGAGSSGSIGEHASKLGKHALLVTDPGLSAVGHPRRIAESLEEQGIRVTTYDQSIENPTETSVQDCVRIARQAVVDHIIGLGGGSSMDTAKGCNFILTNGGRMADYWGVGRASREMLPFIALPTTAGTGSECQSFALISEDETHRKMACGDKKALPSLTILDPELTLSQPQMVTSCTGIDALTHALESAVTNKRNDFSDRHARMAFGLIDRNLPRVFDVPEDLDARGGMLLGASHAGAAIEQSMLGAAHSMANPLTARKGTVHGIAVGLALPVVMEFNAGRPETMALYALLARECRLCPAGSEDPEASAALVGRVRELLSLADFPASLDELGFTEEEIPTLAKEASEQWTAGFNPRPVEADDFVRLYASLFSSTSCYSQPHEIF